MAISNFIFDKQNESVSWSYSGRMIRVCIQNIQYASPNEYYIYIEAGNDYLYRQVYYLSLKGNQIFSLDRLNGRINWHLQGHSVEIQHNNISEAQFYIEHDIVIVLTGDKLSDRKLLIYALDGTLMFEKKPPSGYYFYRLSSTYISMSSIAPSVVCEGGKEHADSFGRSEWHFTINPKTGDLTKASLAY